MRAHSESYLFDIVENRRRAHRTAGYTSFGAQLSDADIAVVEYVRTLNSASRSTRP